MEGRGGTGCECVCGGACMCGVWAETEAERHSQAKDNAVCVCVCVCVRVRAHACTYVSGVGRRSVCLWGRGGVWRSLWHVRPCEECVAGGEGGGRCVVWVCGV